MAFRSIAASWLSYCPGAPYTAEISDPTGKRLDRPFFRRVLKIRLKIHPHRALSRGHTIALVLRRCAAEMISLRLAVPTALALVGLAGCLTYFLIAPAPVSQSAALAAPPAAEAPSTVGQARAIDRLTVVDRLRPSDEDIVKAFRQATEDRQPGETQDDALDTDQPAGPVPLPKRRPAPRP